MSSKRNPSPFARSTVDSPPSTEQVNEQLNRILTDPEFRATEAQRAFLSYVVDKVISGKSEDIKGYTIATQVFGRRDDFDQATDPIVSIHANKLRRALEHYYLVKGVSDPLRIEIPKGTYVPTFYANIQSVQPETFPARKKVPVETSWPVVLVMPFENHSNEPDLDLLTVGLQTELVQEITRYMDIRVLMYPGNVGGRRITDSGARFMLGGNILKDPGGIKVMVNLTDTQTGIRLWGDVYQSDYDAAQLFSFQEEVSRTIVSRIAGECGIIAKTISAESKKTPPAELSTYQALLRYHEFNRTFSLENFSNAFESLNVATSREPDCGRAWSMLARLHATNATLELFDAPTTLEQAHDFAQKGVRLEQSTLITRLVMAFIHMIQGHTDAGLQEVSNAASLNPNATIHLEHIGYLRTLCGDWEHGPAIIRKAIGINPFYDVIVHHALWLDHVRQKKYHKALLETYNFRTPSLFWDHLLRAAALGLTDNIDEGKTAAAHLLTLKPDFTENGRRLMEYYLKFDETITPTIEGLQRVGVDVE